MKLRFSRFFIISLAILAGISQMAVAQTLTITNGVQKYGSLSSTTVTMSGKCELWVTNSSAPLSGCTIDLNSVDAWLFVSGVKPSVVTSTYLSQVLVNGAAAVADSNVRVVQYGQYGAIVIPQAPGFQPLTVFTGPQFSGTARQYSQWTYYTGVGNTNISSFKLKRGYQVVFAQSSNGKNWSKCYVAQDGDLEVGVMPTTLDKQVQFIYVTPWRWTSKKGIAGNPGNSWLNLLWWYDWNIDQSSTSDLEYVAIRQNQSWPSLSQNWQSLGVNTLLGYNEPDQANQANLTISQAISSWGDLLATGLRVGSPATSDGGPNSWLIPFVQQADAAGLRVDFVATHYYQANNPTNASACASQMYNFLLNIWNNTHRPIWVTEWNNGANWTDNSPYPPPTYAQQQACVQAMVNMLETTPFVERYALYNWVEDTRSLITSSNTVTPAGTFYSNTVSALSYSQAMPNNGTRGVAEFLFNTNTWDSSGYCNNGMAIGEPAYTTGRNSQAQAIVLDGTNNYVQLPANLGKTSGFTFAGWVYWNGGAAWQRIFDFGNDTSHYLFLTPNSGSGTLRCGVNNGTGDEIIERAGALASNSWQHVAVTLNGSTAVLYVNGAQVTSVSNFTNTPALFSPIKNYFGKSQFPADPMFSGEFDEFVVADYAMSAAQISAVYNSSTPYPAYTGGVWTNDADSTWSASTNWNNGMIANGPGILADFSTINISSNRTVTVDAARTIGGMKFGDLAGSQNWFLIGASTLTLDGGSPNMATIAVNQNTATVSAALAGTGGFAKIGNGALTLNGNDSVGGGLSINAGSVNVAGGATTFGSSISYVGYETGSGNLNVSNGNLSIGGELRIGGSDQNGSQYDATGTAAVANATVGLGALTLARGNYLDNSCAGTLTLNSGGTLISTNDVIIKYAGTGLGKLVINGGNFIIGPAATKWFMLGFWDTGPSEFDISSGNLSLDYGSSIKMCRGNNNVGTNVVNQSGGSVTFYSDAGVTLGGGGSLDLNYSGPTNSTSTYNLNGGTLTVPQIISSVSTGSHTFNFSGGTLKSTGNNASFMQGLTAANVRSGGVVVDDGGFNITIAQPLLHSTIAGDPATDGGLTKLDTGVLTLSGVNIYNGNTTITAGTLALGSAGSINNSANIAVASGASLDVSAVAGGFTLGTTQTVSGSGTVNGTVANNGIISPGTPGAIGTLTLNNSPTLTGAVLMKIDRNGGAPLSDQISLPSTAVNYGGTLNVTNVGADLQAGDVFQLFNATGYGGSFALTNLPPLDSGLAWSNSLALNGSIAVVSVVSLTPTNIAWSVSGTNLTLSWPADHTGWRLQVQTNSVNGTDWVDVPGANLTNYEALPLDPAAGSMFYRMIYP